MSQKTTRKPRAPKSYETLEALDLENPDADMLGRSYYLYLLEAALFAIVQARKLVAGDPVEENHELELIQRLISEAYEAA